MDIKDHFLEELTIENSALLLIDHQVGTNFVSGVQTNLGFRNAVRALAKSAAAGAVDKIAMMATILRVQQRGAIVAPWYAFAADWQKNWTLAGGTGLGEIFAEHLVHYEYVAQAQQDNFNAAKGITHS